uniref:Integrase catalytic domain-containing protein n=1 Tax=Ananas comosus var. bracteatus TaxID=296719 RepID=A0A6V7NH70_ANACO|nr:unnamed protein product [Ananas comosus var. bracteatus]
MVHGLPVIKHSNAICEGCIIGKQTRLPFMSSKTKFVTKPLNLVHIDICGPLPESRGGNKYFIGFIDDCTRKIWIYFTKEKSAAFSTFKKYKALVERESGNKIKILRSDRGGEYTSNEFKDYCNKEGIQQQFTTAYSPQQNEKPLPKSFWAEAVACATYLINRSPTKSLKNMTPEEGWSGYKPGVKHLKIFGCIAYAQIPKEKRKKLDDRGEKCIFTGYSEHSKAYKLYNPITNKVIISKDVIFDENGTWNWNTEEKGKRLIDQEIEETDNVPTDNDTPSPMTPALALPGPSSSTPSSSLVQSD